MTSDQELSERLLQNGFEVVCLDNLVTGRLANIEPFQRSSGFSYRRFDVIEGGRRSRKLGRPGGKAARRPGNKAPKQGTFMQRMVQEATGFDLHIVSLDSEEGGA